MPVPLATLTMPHCVGQQLIMKAFATGRREYAFQALSIDPLCSHLSANQKKSLAGELWKSNRPWLPKNMK